MTPAARDDDQPAASPLSPAGAAPPPNDPWAVAAVVLGLLAFPLLPIGIVAVAAIVCGLVAVRRGSRSGISSRMPIAGTALGAVSLATVLFLLATGLYDDVVFGDDPPRMTVGPMVVGACMDLKNGGYRACDVAHDAEYFAIFVYEAGDDVRYPGEPALDVYGEPRCAAALTEYAGPEFDRSSVDVRVTPPNEDEWKDGDRRIGCVAVGSPRVGSIARSGP